MRDTLLLLALFLHQVYAVRCARQERRRIELAALARTPAEFAALSAQSSTMDS